jgi:hypothetical protein
MKERRGRGGLARTGGNVGGARGSSCVKNEESITFWKLRKEEMRARLKITENSSSGK